MTSPPRLANVDLGILIEWPDERFVGELSVAECLARGYDNEAPAFIATWMPRPDKQRVVRLDAWSTVLAQQLREEDWDGYAYNTGFFSLAIF